MFTHPDITGQLVRDRQREMLAAVGQRQLRRHHGRQSKAVDIVAAIFRRLAPVIAEPSR